MANIQTLHTFIRLMFLCKAHYMHGAVSCVTNKKYDIYIFICQSATHSLTKFAHFIDIRALNMYDEWLAYESGRQVLMRLDYFILIIIICGAALSSLTATISHIYAQIIIVGLRAIHIRRGRSTRIIEKQMEAIASITHMRNESPWERRLRV